MIKKLKILTVAGIIAVIGIVVLVGVMHKPGGEDIMSQREAEQRVRELKKKVSISIDEGTREKIHTFTSDLTREYEFVEVNGEKLSMSTLAFRELRKIGEPAIPQLIDAAANHSDPVVREYAVGVTHLICQDLDANVMEFLPVFVRSMWDKDARVRVSAVAQISQMASRFYRRKREKELEQLIPYLVKALGDKDYIVQIVAGETLFRIGRRDLVPQELIKKEKFGE